MEEAGFEGGRTGVRKSAGLGAAFSLTYISASQNQHSCQQAGEVGIHCVQEHPNPDHLTTYTHTAAEKYLTKPKDVQGTKTAVPHSKSKNRIGECSYTTNSRIRLHVNRSYVCLYKPHTINSMIMSPRTLMNLIDINIFAVTSHSVLSQFIAHLTSFWGERILCHFRTGTVISRHSRLSGASVKVIGCLLLMCDMSLDSDIWLSDNEATAQALTPSSKSSIYHINKQQQCAYHFWFWLRHAINGLVDWRAKTNLIMDLLINKIKQTTDSWPLNVTSCEF